MLRSALPLALLLTAVAPHLDRPAVAGSARLVADLNAGATAASLRARGDAIGLAFFAVDSAGSGEELWRSDGTTADSFALGDLCPGPCGSDPSRVAELGGRAYFTARRSATELALFVSDGGRTGTSAVLALCLGAGCDGDCASVTAAGGRLWIVAPEAPGATALFVSDGTAAGTSRLAGLGSASCSPETRPVIATVAGGVVLRLNEVLPTGQRAALWHSDGTAAGTGPLLELCNPCLLPTALASTGAVAILAGAGPEGIEPWQSDGTTSGTGLLADLEPGPGSSSPAELTAVGSQVWFRAATGTAGLEPWVSDGTTAGTRSLGDLCPGTCSSRPGGFRPVPGHTLFVADDDLWRSDGSAAGTERLADLGPAPEVSGAASMLAAPGYVLFSGRETATGSEPWRSDGTPAGTFRLADLVPGAVSSAPAPLGVAGTVAVFAFEPSLPERAIAASDGSAGGTRELLDLAPGPTASSTPHRLEALGDELLFESHATMRIGDILWASDGASGAPVELHDLFLDTTVATTLAAGRSYRILTSDFGHRFQLLESDGTPGGTRLVTTLCPSGGDCATSTTPGIAGLDASPVFVMETAATGAELHILSGGAPLLLADIVPGSTGSSPSQLTRVETRVYFTATDGSTRRGLWATDGSPAGTRGVAVPSSEPTRLTACGSLLYFTLAGSPSQLWRSDGSASGTRLVADLSPATITDLPAAQPGPELWLAVDGEPWRSDGTAAGTTLVRDICPGSCASLSRLEIAWLGTTALFRADDGIHGRELWRSDGTSAGTLPVVDLCPGTCSGAAPHVATFAGRAFFAGDDAVSGLELWSTDGTASGTRIEADIASLSASSRPVHLTPVGARLYFTADDGLRGRELWVYQDIPPPSLTLLRSTAVTSLDPLTPLLSTVLPLDPVRDLYLAPFVSGASDPDPGILTDAAHPLVFYGTEGSETLHLAKTTDGRIRVSW